VPPVQRQNLAEVCKMLNQISVGRLFGQDQQYLTPMNDFISSSVADFSRWIYDGARVLLDSIRYEPVCSAFTSSVIHVEDAEVHFRADEYIDAAAARRPVIYISPNDIYSTHNVIADNIEVIVRRSPFLSLLAAFTDRLHQQAPDEDDALRAILAELGGVPASNTVELSRARADEIALTLMTRMRPHEGASFFSFVPSLSLVANKSFADPNAGNKALFNQAKRRVLGILKVHHGADLEAVLAQVVTREDEEAWLRIVQEEEEEERRQAHAQRRNIVPQADDIRRFVSSLLAPHSVREN
jgi:Ras GTPase-activating-like protein IQGAP2/3